MEIAVRRIRYGTALKNFYTTVRSAFPNAATFPLADPKVTNAEDPLTIIPFPGQSVMCEPLPTAPQSQSAKYFPSVSTALGCTDNCEPLYRWQKKIIAKEGREAFEEMFQERVSSGRLFHSVVEELLKELQTQKKITSTAKECLLRLKKGEEFESRMVGFLEDVARFLADRVKYNPGMMMEKSVINPMLCYTGRFDAVVELDGHLTLVDWKTVSAASDKSQSELTKTAADLYSYPIQLAAYAAAINLNPEMPHIDRAAVVLAYEDQCRAVEVVTISRDELENYFIEFRRRMNRFWWDIEHKRPRGQVMDFAFTPMEVHIENAIAKKLKRLENEAKGIVD